MQPLFRRVIFQASGGGAFTPHKRIGRRLDQSKNYLVGAKLLGKSTLGSGVLGALSAQRPAAIVAGVNFRRLRLEWRKTLQAHRHRVLLGRLDQGTIFTYYYLAHVDLTYRHVVTTQSLVLLQLKIIGNCFTNLFHQLFQFNVYWHSIASTFFSLFYLW